ncbi:hypothetical protein Tco_0170971, partial [Tanacetum coccineum]
RRLRCGGGDGSGSGVMMLRWLQWRGCGDGGCYGDEDGVMVGCGGEAAGGGGGAWRRVTKGIE